MAEWWNGLELIQQIFALLAIPATVILIVQTILVLIGAGGDDISDFDADLDIDPNIDTNYIDNQTSSGDGLSLFTVRGIVAFFAVGGWLGVFLIDAKLSIAMSIIISVIAGFAAMVGIAYLFRALRGLQSSGNLMISNSIGKTATVYVSINPGKIGKIHVTFQERYTELNAVSSDDEGISAGTFVKIIKVLDEETVVVEKINNDEREIK